LNKELRSIIIEATQFGVDKKETLHNNKQHTPMQKRMQKNMPVVDK
jgi:hypothetical protein